MKNMHREPFKIAIMQEILPLKVNLRNHRLRNVRFVPSSNADVRPEGMPIDLIVIHGISLPPNEFGGPGVEQLFTNQLNPAEHPYYQEIEGLRVSAHIFIRRTGEIIQFVPFNLRAWHAGLSQYQGRERCNDFSIGIELEGTDDLPYELIQYQVLSQIVKALTQAYPEIKENALVGHNEISPGRKTDPGMYFNWQILADTLNVVLDKPQTV